MISKIAIALILLMLLVGCGKDRPVAGPVDPEKARAALKQTLDAWKEGKSIESLNQSNPPIVAQDLDWMAGAKLDAYEITDTGIPLDANLKVAVKLSIRGKTPKTVNYIVGTDIKLTVFRSLE